jgi:hypothetical protein
MQSSETGLRSVTGNFLKFAGQNRLSDGSRLFANGNSIVARGGYSIIQALSCYSAKQAPEAQNR